MKFPTPAIFFALGLSACLLPHIAFSQVAFEKGDGHMEITVDGKPFATYAWNDPTTTRPYFKNVRARGGEIQVTRNHPPREGDIDDHSTFHPGIWWGFGDVGGNDYWRLKARVIGGDFVVEPEGGKSSGHFSVRNQLLENGGDKIFCEQVCQYTILPREDGILLICESTFVRDEGDFWLGDQEEMGLAARVATPLAMASKKGGRIINSKGETDLETIRTTQSDWCDYSGPVDARFGGILVMNDPANFRKPWWHAVETGLLIANPLGESELSGNGKKKENVFVKKGEPFQLRYGVLIHLSDDEKSFDPEDVFKDFTTLLKNEDKNASSVPRKDLPVAPEGFEVSVFAEEPLVYKPTSLCFDARGRLFVGQGPQYPHHTEETPPDSVDLLLDTDGDGVADTKKTFATGFNSVQSLAWKGNDLYVANAPELTVVRDLDGDDIADEYVVIYTDLGNREHALHGLNFGPDGKLYLSKGNSKGHNQPEEFGGIVAPRPFRELWGVVHPPGAPDTYPPKSYTKEAYHKTFHDPRDDWGREGGVLRCDSMGENLEIISRGMRNPWDIAMDEGFNWLGTDNDQTQGDRIIMPFFGAHFGWGHSYSSHWTGEGNLPTVPVSGPLFSGSGAGIVYYDHKQFPADYQGVFFINDWLFGTYLYRPSWQGALRKPEGNAIEPFLSRARDGIVYRPTDLEFGPDGALYSLGWGGNYDYEMGKEGSWVFRVSHGGATPLLSNQNAGFESLSNQSVAELVSQTGTDSLPARRVAAQDELVRRGKEATEEILEQIALPTLPTGQQTWAAWALGRIRDINPKTADTFSRWADTENRFPENLRIQAIRILGFRARWFDEPGPLEAFLEKGFSDTDPRIRFETMQAIQQAGPSGSVPAVVAHLDGESDRLVFYTGWQALRAIAPEMERRALLQHKKPRVRLAALLGLQEDHVLSRDEAMKIVETDSDADMQSWALTYALNPAPPESVPNSTSRIEREQTVPVGDLIKRAKQAIDRKDLRRLYLTMIGRASVRGDGQKKELLSFYRKLKKPEERALILPAVALSFDAIPDLWDAFGKTADLTQAATEGVRNLVRLKTEGLGGATENVENAAESTFSNRAAAAEIAAQLLDLVAKTKTTDLRIPGALDAIHSLPLPENWSPESETVDALCTILENEDAQGSTRSVLRILSRFHPANEKEQERVAHALEPLCAEPNAVLYRDLQAVTKHWNLSLTVPPPSPATVAGVLPLLEEADPERGRELFFDSISGGGCLACHRVRGQGSAFAPDLSGVGIRLTPENIARAVIEPSAAITEGYSLESIATRGGEAFLGAPLQEDSTSLTLVQVDGTRVAINKGEIANRQKLNQSVMPAAYALFGNQAIADLTAWLATLRDGGSEG